MHILLSMNSSLPVTMTPLLSSASTTQPCSMRLRKQTRKRFYVGHTVPIFRQLGSSCNYNQLMFGEESTLFPKQIKIDDYSPYEQGNVISIVQSSNLLLGSGARSSNAAVVLAKTLHYRSEEGAFSLVGKNVLDLGCGVGLVGIYLACLGSHVMLADCPSLKDLVERNIGLNKALLKGKIDFTVANWKNINCIGKCLEISEGNSTTSSEKQECLLHLMDKIDITIICQGGGMVDLESHLKWFGRQGLILCFMERQGQGEDYLTSRGLEQILIEKELNYARIDQYHPDYVDERIAIYHIWK